MKKIIFILLMLIPMIGVAQEKQNIAFAQTKVKTAHMQLNEKAMEVYNNLCELFPMTYVGIEFPWEVDYFIHAKFKDLDDFNNKKKQLNAIVDKVLQIAYTRRSFDNNENGQNNILIKVKNPDDTTGWLKMEWNNQTLEFVYYITTPPSSGLAGVLSCQPIVDDLDLDFKRLTKKNNVQTQDVAYEGDVYGKYTFNSYKYPLTQGKKYIIDASYDDFTTLANKMKAYSFKNDVHVMYSNVYGRYEQIGLCCYNDKRCEVCFATAFKDGKLYLVRVESGRGGPRFLPRAWAEDNPKWTK